MTADEVGRLRAALSWVSPGKVHLSQLWGAEWDRLPIGDRVRLGNRFLAAVRDGQFPGLLDTGRKDRAGRVYLWQPRGH